MILQSGTRDLAHIDGTLEEGSVALITTVTVDELESSEDDAAGSVGADPVGVLVEVTSRVGPYGCSRPSLRSGLVL